MTSSPAPELPLQQPEHARLSRPQSWLWTGVPEEGFRFAPESFSCPIRLWKARRRPFALHVQRKFAAGPLLSPPTFASTFLTLPHKHWQCRRPAEDRDQKRKWKCHLPCRRETVCFHAAGPGHWYVFWLCTPA